MSALRRPEYKVLKLPKTFLNVTGRQKSNRLLYSYRRREILLQTFAEPEQTFALFKTNDGKSVNIGPVSTDANHFVRQKYLKYARNGVSRSTDR